MNTPAKEENQNAPSGQSEPGREAVDAGANPALGADSIVLSVGEVGKKSEVSQQGQLGPEKSPLAEEFMRALLAWVFVLIFALTVVWAFINVEQKMTWEHTKELLTLLLPAETALLGSAVGYYFGSRK